MRVLIHRWGWFSLLLVWSACAKESIDYPIWEVQTPTTLPLTDLHMLNANEGFLSVGDHFSKGLVLTTADGGRTWDTLSTYNTGIRGLSKSTASQLYIGESGQVLHQYSYGFSSSTPYNSSTVQQFNTGGWWSWHSLLELSSGTVLLAGGENFGRGFVHRYTQGQWDSVQTFVHELRDLAQTPDGAVHAVGYGLIVRSTDEGQTWTPAPIEGDFFRGIDFPTADIGYVVGEYGAVYKTTNAGQDWQLCRAGSSVFASPNALLRDLAFRDADEGFLVGTGGLVYRTTDGGKTWKKVENLASGGDYNAVCITQGRAYLLGATGQLTVIELE